MSNLKIICISNYADIKGGADRVFHNEAELLSSAGHNVLKFCASNTLSGLKAKSNTLSEYYIPTIDLSSGDMLDRLNRLVQFHYRADAAKELELCISDFNPDIAHLHIFYGQLTNSVLSTLKKLKIKTVVTIHDYRLLCPVSTMVNSKKQICHQCVEKSKFQAIALKCNKNSVINSLISVTETMFRDYLFNYQKHIDKFIFVSTFAKNLHIKYFPEISNKSIVINNFANLAKISHGECYEQSDYYCYFGRLATEKGVDTICEVFSKEKLPLIIIGTGPEEEHLKKKYKNSLNIRFLGFMELDIMVKYISKAKFTILPSEWYENYPLSIIESFTLGVPVIGANIGGIPELISEGENGFLFRSSSIEDFTNTLRKAEMCSTQEVRSMGSAGREFVKDNLSAEAHVEKLFACYINTLK